MKDFKCLEEATIFKFFFDEDLCRQYLTYRRWKGNVWCPHCKYADAYAYADGRMYRCKHRRCKKTFTVTTGTVFHMTKAPLRYWFRAIYEMLYNPRAFNAHALWKRLSRADGSIRYETIYYIHQRIMEMLRVDHDKVRKRYGTYEFDGVYCGPDLTKMSLANRAKHPNLAGLTHKVRVAVVVNRGKSLHAKVMPYNTKLKQEQTFLKGIMPKRAIAYSDCDILYRGLKNYISKYRQFNHSKNEYGDGDAHTNTLNGIVNEWRKIEGQFHCISNKYLQRYLDEFCYRYNCKYKGLTIEEQFDAAFENMDRRITYKDLQKEGKANDVYLNQNINTQPTAPPPVIAKSCPRIAIKKRGKTG